MTDHALVVLSGGLDSTTCLALAVKEHGAEYTHAVSFQYGQRHSVELDCAREIAKAYDVSWNLIPIDVFNGPRVSALLSGSSTPMPEMTYDEISSSHGVSPTYVPYRNGMMLSIAVAKGLANLGDDDTMLVYAGMHAEDARGWAYPDCTPEFVGAMANAIYVGTYHRARLVAPLQYKSKAEVVALGLSLQVPFIMTHSCYLGERPACGVCPTCVGRLEAFKTNGITDPLPYREDARVA